MLANKHPDEFKIHLDTIMNDTIKRAWMTDPSESLGDAIKEIC
jgi:hypothetical protein